MKSRQVRSETGALFDVDAEMVEDGAAGAGPFRASSAPLSTAAILPATARRRWQLPVIAVVGMASIAGGALALGLSALLFQ
jgi:hypothetical protein